MRDVIIIAGHTNVPGLDRGASSGKYIEGELTVQFRDLIINELSKLGIKAKTDSNKNALAQTLAWMKSLINSKTIAIDIHWNAAGETANGTEVIIPDASSSFERQISNAILKCFLDLGFRNRGVKPESATARKRLGWMRPNCENVLIETCFITSKSDMALYEANKNLLAKKIAKVIFDFCQI